ncbi:alpha/beta fold hydrolase [Granulicoccus phenolivorans]|uniref:alpha/beta fold hydrolase n=1 Tax=Granulicoccus phenolivorans TaxID=266854 RepID=UPI00040E6618|nr:alpha/beta fold hydrolase [Granulicoccus phenolivorans]
MTGFVLIHGGGSGPWCWDGVRRQLENHGHTVAVPDLGVDPTATLLDYRDRVLNEMEPIDTNDDVVVVGWSGVGSAAAVLVGAERPTRAVVNLAGTVPFLDRSLNAAFEEQIDRELLMSLASDTEEGGVAFGPAARHVLFADVPDDVYAVQVESARTQPTGSFAEAFPLTVWPPIRFVSVLGRRDPAIRFDAVARRTEKVGGEVIGLDEGHAPHLSNPAGVARVLMAL